MMSTKVLNSTIDKGKKVFFDDTIVDMVVNKKLHPDVTELLIKDMKVNISLVFITQSHFPVPKHLRLNTTCTFSSAKF